MDKMLTTEDIMNTLHISKTSCYKLFSLKGFPYIKIGRSYLVSEEKFNKWVNDNTGNHILL